jgi:hypothetical protein
VPEPIALAADHAHLGWMARLIKLGAIAGLSSVILVMMLGQTRVFLVHVARRACLPPVVSRVHPRFKTPWIITIATGVVVAFFGAVLPVRDAGNLCNIGTLLAFVIVSVGVLVLRVREPDLQRKSFGEKLFDNGPIHTYRSVGFMAKHGPETGGRSSGRRSSASPTAAMRPRPSSKSWRREGVQAGVVLLFPRQGGPVPGAGQRGARRTAAGRAAGRRPQIGYSRTVD